MSGVFLSYSRGDRALAERVLKSLRSLGVDVWWDEDMPGVDWQEELARQINELAAVVVVWTPLSTNSNNVRDEARLGQHTEKLVNALAGVTSPPFPFDRTNGLPLDGWTGREPHSGWTRLVATIDAHIAATGAIKRGELAAALVRREAEIRRLKQALADAEETLQATKADEATASAAATEARAQLAACDDQMRRVAEIARGPGLLRAAQADLDAAMVAEDEAEKARKSAVAALASASLTFSRAKTALERVFEEAPLAPPAPPPSAPRPAPPPPKPAPPPAPDPAPVPAPPPSPASRSLASSVPTPTLTEPARSPPRGNTPVIVILVGAVVVLLVVGVISMKPGSQAPNAAVTSDSNAAAASSNAAMEASGTASPAPSGAEATAAPASGPTALVGNWQGEGATCASPLVIAVSGQALSLTMMGQTTTGAIQSAAGAAFKVQWPDGVWSYQVTGPALRMVPPKGRSFGYVRCAG